MFFVQVGSRIWAGFTIFAAFFALIGDIWSLSEWYLWLFSVSCIHLFITFSSARKSSPIRFVKWKCFAKECVSQERCALTRNMNNVIPELRTHYRVGSGRHGVHSCKEETTETHDANHGYYGELKIHLQYVLWWFFEVALTPVQHWKKA